VEASMIRILEENDRTLLMDYIKKESELNLFIIGDIENYGFGTDFQKLWGRSEDHTSRERV
jgi:hypothetical protein